MTEEDEAALFREAVRGVRRLRGPERVEKRARPPAPRARFARAARTELLEATAPQPLDPAPEPGSFRRPGVGDKALRELRRGRLRVEAQLDLHGLTEAQAVVRLQAFLCASLDRGLRCVRIVHGKGLRSGERGPVLRRAAHELLQRAAAVKAFVPARLEAGGSGATDVLIASSPFRRRRR